MTTRKYTPNDEKALFQLLADEGEEWADYHAAENREKYRRALESSVTYLAYEGDTLCGYTRCRDDDGYGVYIYDLLVAKPFRGRDIGRKIMEKVCGDYPDNTVYVMSDVDGYYSKLGYKREGSIFIVGK